MATDADNGCLHLPSALVTALACASVAPTGRFAPFALAGETHVMWRGHEACPTRFVGSLWLLATVLAGCAATGSPPAGAVQPPDLPGGSIVLVQPNRFNEHYIRFEVPTEVIITSQTELDSLRLRQAGTLDPSHPIEVDFVRFILLYVTMGHCPSGGYDISLRGVHEGINEIVVDLVETIPGRRCGVTDLITYPTALALLRRTQKPVLFRKVTATTVCDE